MKNLKKVLALVLAVVMIMSVVTVASAKTYTDVKGTDNYADAIDALSSLKILDGFEDGTFKADGTLNRAQAAKIVAIVHNAATNGKIDADIADLYANAQNPFVDCNTSWALPYINYCRITGLADGMTATTYAPKREVTGVQFLKLMLTTLNFNTAKEGYTGTGWDINVLNRANEIGLTAGLKDGWKAIAPIKRGEAAQILYNALTAYLVEYGQKVKNTVSNVKADTNKANFYYTESFISNEQVAKSGYTLGAKMGVKITRTNDVFMRPGYMWAYGSWSAFYMDAPVASYTTATTMCDVLVDAAKIAKTSNLSATYYFFRDGVNSQSRYLQEADHTTDACTKTTLGGNGALTQVFKVAYVDGGKVKAAYIITVIDTFLAKVDTVAAAKHHTVNVTTTVATLYAGANQKFTNHNGTLTVPYLSDYAKNDYVLFNVSTGAHNLAVGTNDADNTLTLYKATALAYDNTNRDVYGATLTANTIEGLGEDTVKYAVPVQKAGTIAAATFSGQDYKRDTVTVNGTRTPVNCTYTMTGIFSTNYVTEPIKGGKLTTNFFTDQYNNVIGDSDVFASNYAVIDSIMWVNDGGLDADKYAQAKLIGVDAASTLATVVKYNGKDLVAAKTGNWGNPAATPAAEVAQDNSNNGWYYDNGTNVKLGVVSYTVDADGKYSVKTIDNSLAKYAFNTSFGIKAGQVKIEANGQTIYASNDTKFVVRTKSAGKTVYTAYAGINALPTMSNLTDVVAVYNTTTDNYAAFIFLVADNAIFAGSDTVAYVTDVKYTYAENGDIYHYDVYINGEKTEIIATADTYVPGAGYGVANNLFTAGTGLYTLHFGTDDKKVTSASPLAPADGWYHLPIIKGIDDSTAAITVGISGNEFGLNVTNAKVYVVDTEEGTVAVGAVTDLVAGSDVIYKLVDKSDFNVETIFVMK